MIRGKTVRNRGSMQVEFYFFGFLALFVHIMCFRWIATAVCAGMEGLPAHDVRVKRWEQMKIKTRRKRGTVDDVLPCRKNLCVATTVTLTPPDALLSTAEG